MTYFYSFAEIGKRIANRGWNLRDTEDHIKNLPPVSQQNCLMAALLEEIRGLRRDIAVTGRQAKQESPKEYKGNAIADGMIVSWSVSRGDIPVPQTYKELRDAGLGVRARKAVIRSGAEFLSQLNEESLADLRNCGETTVKEIVEWKAKYARSEAAIA